MRNAPHRTIRRWPTQAARIVACCDFSPIMPIPRGRWAELRKAQTFASEWRGMPDQSRKESRRTQSRSLPMEDTHLMFGPICGEITHG
jgi:hypothetical protein